MENYQYFGVVDLTRKMSIDLLNSVEISSQEAAQWLLRKSTTTASSTIIFIPTSWPIDRQRIKKCKQNWKNQIINQKILGKKNILDKYEQRPNELNDLNVSQFSAYYEQDKNEKYKKLNKL